ncbi:MAG: hypothetical protein PVG32_19800 [Anaerolineales bacterium]|jgi:hypothetical protein
MNRRIGVSILVIIVVACIVLSVVSVIAAGALFFNQRVSNNEATELVKATLPKATPSPQMEPTTTSSLIDATPSPQDDTTSPTLQPQATSTQSDTKLDSDVLAQMEEIQAQVINVRGLQPNTEVNRILFSTSQLRERLVKDFREDYTPDEVEADKITLAAFGLLERDFDLTNFYIDLLTEQVAGFYDQETKEMVVVQGEGFKGPERLTYAHEYTHALQDQNYDIENGLNYNDDACEDDSERCAGIQALIEGDASLSELNWFFEYSTSQDQTEIFEFYEDINTPILDSAPAFLSEDFIFPYQEGFDFVQYLYDRGGWSAVNAAYEDLPLSTEQILHPERYPDDKPVIVTIPDLSEVLNDGWEEVDRDVMGEWYTYLMLSFGKDTNTRLETSDAKLAVDGWEGDSYVVYYNKAEESTVLVLQSLWDSNLEAEQFASAFNTYATSRFGAPVIEEAGSWEWKSTEGYSTFSIKEQFTTWIIAPEKEVTEVVQDLLE